MTEFRVVEREETPSLTLRGLQVLSAKESTDLFVISAETISSMRDCPKCRVGGELIAFGRKEQEFRDMPVQGKHVRIFVSRRRYRCKACGKTSLELLPWAHEERYATKRLVEAIERDALISPNFHVAHRYGVDEKTIKNILDAYITRLDAAVKFETPTWLGIGEVQIVGKSRALMTNIQLQTLVEMLPDCNKTTIFAYLQSLETHKVKVVSMAMRRPYRDAVREVIPHAVVVVDKFHVISLANSALESIRKGWRSGLDAKGRKSLKNDRSILLKRRQDLTVVELGELDHWKRNFPDLIAAYNAKEMFFDMYDVTSAKLARIRYERWLNTIPLALREKGGPWYGLVDAMQNWEREIMAYFDHPVTNAYTTSMNRIIRDIDRGGRGYSFPALRAKTLHGQEFRKRKKLASVSSRSRGMTFYMALGPGAGVVYLEFGADLHRVADSLEEQAKQHEQSSGRTSR